MTIEIDFIKSSHLANFFYAFVKPMNIVEFRSLRAFYERANKDVISYFGSKSLVSQVLSRQRNLSLKMIKALHIGLRLPYEVLLAE